MSKSGVAKDNFQAEISVTLRSGQGGNGCAFFGLGSGQPDPKSYNEPTSAPSLVFRMAPNDFCSGTLTETMGGQMVEESQLGDGTHRLCLSWDAARKCEGKFHRKGQSIYGKVQGTRTAYGGLARHVLTANKK